MTRKRTLKERPGGMRLEVVEADRSAVRIWCTAAVIFLIAFCVGFALIYGSCVPTLTP